MLRHARTVSGGRMWTGSLHGVELDLFVERDPDFPPLWRWRRFERARLVSQQTCVSESEAVRWLFDWLSDLRERD